MGLAAHFPFQKRLQSTSACSIAPADDILIVAEGDILIAAANDILISPTVYLLLI